jgi:hypothetical protein
MRLYLIIFISIFLSGCVGVQFVNNESKIISLEKSKETSTKEYYRISMGEPNKIYNEDGKEYWSYYEELTWSGALVYLIIPIPLIIPTGIKDNIIVFENDIATKRIYEKRHSNFYGCGPLIPLIRGVDGSHALCNKTK